MSYIIRMSGLAATLALTGLLVVAPVIPAQESASIQSQCQREAQDYGIEPEQIEEYVNGCVQAYGGMPAAAPEAQPAEAGADAPVAVEPDMSYSGAPDAGAALE